MIKRIVKLTFRPDVVADFKAVFKERKSQIRSFPGCRHLELWQDKNRRNIFFTYSFWDTEEALNAYRHSELFQATWKRTKVLFEDKPEAWSVETIEHTP